MNIEKLLFLSKRFCVEFVLFLKKDVTICMIFLKRKVKKQYYIKF